MRVICSCGHEGAIGKRCPYGREEIGSEPRLNGFARSSLVTSEENVMVFSALRVTQAKISAKHETERAMPDLAALSLFLFPLA
jgi:hypothetical protein